MSVQRPRSTPTQRRPQSSIRSTPSRDVESNSLMSMKDMLITSGTSTILPNSSPNHHYSVNKLVKKLMNTSTDSTVESRSTTPTAFSSSPSPKHFINQGRDVSYLSDRQHHGFYNPNRPKPGADRSAFIPPTKIPKEFHVHEFCIDPQNSPEAFWDDESKVWKHAVFPSLVPSGRTEVVLLEECYEKMLSEWERTIKSHNGPEKALSMDDFDAAKRVYLACFVEVVRQVTVQCVERGRLLTRLWNAFVGMNDKQRQFIVNILEGVHQELSELRHEHSSLQREYDVFKSEYDQRSASITNELEQLKKENYSLKEKIIDLRTQVDSLLTYKDSNIKSSDAIVRYQELLERLHEYSDVIRDSYGDIPGMPKDSAPAPVSDSDEKISSSSIYGRLPTYLKDLEYLKHFSKNLKKRLDSEYASKIERQTHWERVNQSLLEELERLRKSKIDRPYVETETQSTQTETESSENTGENEAEEMGSARTSEEAKLQKNLPLASWRGVIGGKLCSRILKGGNPGLSTKALLKLITNIYQDKMAADDVDDKIHHPRQTMIEFVYDFFINKYGLRPMAEGHLVNMLATLIQYRGDNIRIVMFANFCGVLPEEVSYPKYAIDFYLQIYKQLYYSPIGTTYAETDDGVIWTPLARCIAIFNGISAHLDNETRELYAGKMGAMGVELQEELTTLVPVKVRKPGDDVESISMRPGRKKVPSEKVVDIDLFIFACIQEWISETNRTMAYLEAMFFAADTSGDGLLQPDEFHTMIEYVDPFTSERQIMRIFSDVLKKTEEGIDFLTFLQVAKAQNFGFSMHDGMALQPEKAFAAVARNWGNTEPIVEQALSFCQRTERQEDYQRIVGRKELFVKLLQEKAIPQAAWITFKALMVDVASVRKPPGKVT
eukprot:TRINITY_DN2335_c0_g1_i10.p1 TRINITY_DN2335_c0_g1~~TRINITY_DN2335_c0_g1_i10.p1  ORF type:complete len:889 (+),score=186.16 TRINITY_DN2335_c0_g1_i10:45-2711(+)